MNQKYEAFIRIAKLGSFKQASEEMGYTQAGIGYLISSLEKELGVTLFTRDRTGASLTTDGQALLPWARDVFNAERVLENHLSEIKNLESGTVRIASLTSVNINWLPHIMEQFLKDHPNVNLEVFSYENQDIIEEAISHGEYDVAFATGTIKSDFDVVKLASDPLFVSVATNHRLAHAKEFTSKDMESVPYIKVRNTARSEVDDLFEQHKVKPSPWFEGNTVHEVMALVAQGFGYGVFSKLILQKTSFKLAVIKPEISMPRTISLFLKSLDNASFATRAFVSCVTQWARKTQKV